MLLQNVLYGFICRVSRYKLRGKNRKKHENTMAFERYNVGCHIALSYELSLSHFESDARQTKRQTEWYDIWTQYSTLHTTFWNNTWQCEITFNIFLIWCHRQCNISALNCRMPFGMSCIVWYVVIKCCVSFGVLFHVSCVALKVQHTIFHVFYSF